MLNQLVDFMRAGFRGSSAEAESTYQPSAEAETVVAEAARKTARKTSKIIRELHRGFRHRSTGDLPLGTDR